MPVTAISSGNWSDGTIWSSASPPGPGDTADIAGFAVVADVSIACISITDSVGTGSLTPSGNPTITANLIAKIGGPLVTAGLNNFTLVGNLILAPSAIAISASGATVTLSGNVSAGAGGGRRTAY